MIKDHPPLVSIIIPVYNRASIIHETLNSISAQEYTNWECVIVDDGSTDTTKEVVSDYAKKDNRFRLFDRPKEHKPGANGARNYGFLNSDGEYIMWLDSDDILNEDYLVKMIYPLMLNTKHDCSICLLAYFKINKDSIIYKTRFGKLLPHMYENVITNRIKALSGTVVFRSKSIKQNIELFDESLLRGQESEYFARLAIKKSLVPKLVNELLIFRRIHIDSKRSEMEQGSELMFKSLFTSHYKVIQLLIAEKKLEKPLKQHLYLLYDWMMILSIKNEVNEVANLYGNLIDRNILDESYKLRKIKFKIYRALLFANPVLTLIFANKRLIGIRRRINNFKIDRF